MATTTSLIVGNLHSVSTYVDSFVVEVYSDPGLTTLVGSGSCGSLSDGSGGNGQAGPIVIAGLAYGGTYYTRAGVVAPYSGLTTWSSTVTVVVGTHVAPSGVTYTVTLTATISGVTVAATPSSIPTDLAYYEAIWTTDGSTPNATAAAPWQGVADGTGTVNFFIGSQIGQTVTIFIRAVNTGGQRQAWTSLGSASASLPSSSANLVLAGPTSGGSGAMTLRALVPADIPSLPESKITNLVTDLAAKVPTSTTVNGHALSSNVVVSASDITTGALPAAQLPIMVASGASHAAGAAPDPGATAGTTKFLREDATWVVPSGSGSAITALTGDVTASGPGSAAATLAATAVTPGSYTNANVTFDTKGRATAASNGSVAPGAGFIQLVQFATAQSTSGTVACTFTRSAQKGSAIVVEYVGTNNVMSISDSQVNIYTQYNPQNWSGLVYLSQFLVLNIPGGAAITVTATGTGSIATLNIYEYNNVAGVNTSISAISNATLSTGTITTTLPSDLIHMTGSDNSNGGAVSNGNGWPLIQSAVNTSFTVAGYNTTQAAPGSVSNTFVSTAGGSGFNHTYVALLALKPMAVVPPTFVSLTTSGSSGPASLTGGVLNIPTPTSVSSLTTSGSSGAATLVSGVLNIPVYGGGGGGGNPGGVTGLVRWFDASQLTGFSDGDPVNSWVEMANGFAASSQGTAPAYKTSILNGHAVVRFGGAGWFRFTAPFDESQFSFFIAMKPSSLSNTYSGIICPSWTSDLGGLLIKSNGKLALYLPGSLYDGTGSATLTTSNFYVVSGVMGPSTFATRVALAADASGSFTPNTGNKFLLLGNHVTSSRVFSGDIAEVIVYGRALSIADTSAVENYLKTKYAL